MEPASAVVVLLGAGAGRRLDAREPKAFLPVGDGPMLAAAARATVTGVPGARLGGLLVVVPAGWEERARRCLEEIDIVARVVAGGDTRQSSVRAALGAVPGGGRIVVVHDAARPFAPPDLFARVLDEVAGGADGAVPVLTMSDTVLRLRGDLVGGAERREELALAQTPQAFRADALREAHEKAEAAGAVFTDDASLVSWAGFVVRAVPGEPSNVKITTPEDLSRADRRMRRDG